MTATDTAETRVRIGKGVHVHRGNADGNTYCGSQGAYRGSARRARSATSFLPADTAVTCTKCGADAVAPAPVAAPAASHYRCENVVYGAPCGARVRVGKTCPMCEPVDD